MRDLTAELKVGLFVLIAGALVIGSWLWSYDGVRADEASYTLKMTVASADGLWEGSDVRLAGVEVGSVESIAVRGDRAGLVLRIRADYQLPVDSEGELKASGLLGDYFVRVYPGLEDELLLEGQLLATRSEPGDIDLITRNLETISEDIGAITAVLREVVENDSNKDNLEATLANVEALTAQMRLIAEQNRADIGAIVDSVRRLTESLEGYTDDIAADVDNELGKLELLTDNLNEAAEDISSITGKVDAGEGTIGALLHERDTIDSLNDTLDEVNSVVKSFSRLQTEVYYTGRYYFGTEPADTTTWFYGNPLNLAGSNTIGLRLRAHEDFWYIFEVNDHPQGTITNKEIFREGTGLATTKWIREPNYRFTFQLSKRWGDFSFRLGVKESGGGVGMTYWGFKDRLQVQLDAFDFTFGSYPAIEDSGIPNIRLLTRVEPWKNIYFEAGGEQLILHPKHGFFTGFVGVGFTFTDYDIRWLLSSLPLGL